MLHNNVRRKLVFTVLIFLLVFGSCQPKKKRVSIQNAAGFPSVSTAGESVPAKKKLVFGTLKKGTASSAQSTAQGSGIISDVDSGNVSAAVMTVSSINGTVEDMVIGELQQFSSLLPDEKDLYNLVKGYFSDLSAGKKDTRALHPLWRKTIERTLGNVKLNRHYTLRIGSFIHKDDTIDARIRILTPIGRSSGEIVAEQDKNVWLISDIAMDFSALERKYTGNDKKFEPDSFINVRLEYE